MRYQFLSISCALIGSCWLRTVVASCYYPDGSFPEDYVYTECSSEGASTCCMQEAGTQCLSNGLCFSPSSNYMYRGACTDKSFDDPACFQHCRNASDTWSAGSYDPIISCGDETFCCSSDSSTCCNDDSKVFSVESGSVIKTLSGTASAALPIATASETSLAPTTKSNSPSKSSLPSSSGSPSSSLPQSSPSESSTPATISKTAIFGLAGGGAALLLLAIFLTFFFLRRRYRKKLAASIQNPAIPLSNTGFQKLNDKPELDSQPMPDKSPRPVEVLGPAHSPAPPYQPPLYGAYAPQQGFVEIGPGHAGHERNPWGQPVYEAPAQPYRGN